MILSDLLNDSVYAAARALLSHGVSVIPLKGKLCALRSWGMAQQYRASQQVLERWNQDGLIENIGIVCGSISGNLVVLDFDSMEAVEDFKDTFPGIQDTLIVSSGSRRGAHYYYYTMECPSSVLVKNYELRSNGMYVVAPPSVHPGSGLRYEVQNRRQPMRLNNMRSIVEWVKSKRPKPPAAPAPQSPAAAPHKRGLSREEWFRDRYVETALQRQVGYVVIAPFGNRNNQLYWSSHAIGQLVGAGALARVRAESELSAAAARAGLPEAEYTKTIKSGLETGMQRPRQIPPPPAPKH